MAMSIVENPLSLVQPLLRPATTDLMKLMSRWDDLMWPQAGISGLHMDIKETKNNYELLVDIPGVDKKDINVSATKDGLTIAAERKVATTTTSPAEEGHEFKRIERFSGHVSRTITLPQGVDTDHINADYHNGVLHIKIPKTDLTATEKSKIIPVK